MKKFDFTIHGNEYHVLIKSVEGNLVELEVNGTPYTVTLNQEVKVSKTPILVRKEIPATPSNMNVAEKFNPVPSTDKPSARVIKSPLPGNVIKVNVSVGDIVKEGDVLMVLESMKMENNILSEKSGKITKVCVTPGKSVLQDEILFEIE
ncbi:MAG TPA: biotin/lipoyl-binding protein [Paludibacteraceae bacterium]|nr:biotin/lipoyl-binding protein [Paludibacteraceae bacterium]HRU63367.1 biotin/lipoyl-binding protein [Paludibacteraceae bacterium]